MIEVLLIKAFQEFLGYFGNPVQWTPLKIIPERTHRWIQANARLGRE